MPVAFVPEARTKVCLEADKARPPEQRVYFLAKFATCRQLDQMFALLEEADAVKLSGDKEADKGRDIHAEREALWRAAMAIGFVGPVDAKDPATGEAIPCTIDGVERVLTYTERWQLITEYPRAISLGEKELGESVPATPAEKSVTGA